ncbi:MAG TPA: adenylate kinase [Candidatus Izemoplasmatales bacterium]|nr:adenylate kinase [Candidatus Izemoplasmatales bacterium]
MNLLIMGKPGAGKGTLASKLLDYYQLTHISTGNIYRDEMAKRSPIGLEAEKYIALGELVPDELTNGIVKDVLATGKFPNGFMLDGYPRTTAQAVALDQMLSERNDRLTAVINIDVSDQVLLERMAGRRVCPTCNALYHVSFHPPKKPGICDVCGGAVIQRNDDKEESVLNRLRIYNEKTKPLLDYYRHKHLLIVFDGNRGSDLVFQEIVTRLDAIQHGHH